MNLRGLCFASRAGSCHLLANVANACERLAGIDLSRNHRPGWDRLDATRVDVADDHIVLAWQRQ